MDELFDVVDEHDRVIGQAPRAVVHARGLRHRAVHVFVRNPAGRIYLQLRAPTKDLCPNTWDSSASGHCAVGEDYDSTAVRELEEELGITVSPDQQPLRRLAAVAARPETGNEFVVVYHLNYDGPVTPNPEEITRGEWYEPAEIDAWLTREPAAFAPAFAYLWRLCSALP